MGRESIEEKGVKMAFTDKETYQSVVLKRPETGSILRIEFRTPLTQVQIEKKLEPEWDRLPGFEFYKLEGKV